MNSGPQYQGSNTRTFAQEQAYRWDLYKAQARHQLHNPPTDKLAPKQAPQNKKKQVLRFR